MDNDRACIDNDITQMPKFMLEKGIRSIYEEGVVLNETQYINEVFK